MLAKGRGRDAMILAKLRSIADGTLQKKPPPKFDLGTHAARIGINLDKGQDSWRYRYVTLKGLKASEYPEDALRYCREDVTSLRAVSKSLRAEFSSPDEWLQVAAAFVLHLAAVWGVRTDGARIAALETRLLAENAECERVLTDGGFFRDGSVNQGAVRAAVERACARLGAQVPKTPTGKTKIDAATIESVASAEPSLESLVLHSANTKILSTYLAPMKGGIDYPMSSRPNVLVASGRTSWAGMELDPHNPWVPEQKSESVRCGFNLQNPPKLEGIRDCIVPRPGYWLCSVDYSSLELRTLAQVCLWTVGRSTIADGYRKDPKFDPHSYFGGHLIGKDYATALALHKSGDKEFAKQRAVAKNINFALPGGVGAKKFVIMAAVAGIEVTVDQATHYKNEWLEAFPEMSSFFDHLSWVADNERVIKQFVSGRVRGDVGYTDGCNTTFQGLAADLAKRALFSVSMACYAEPASPLFGSRVVAFIHDEILAEVPIPKAHAASMEIVRLMNKAFSECCPDIPAESEPTLMTRWIKSAKPRWTENGELTIWQ